MQKADIILNLIPYYPRLEESSQTIKERVQRSIRGRITQDTIVINNIAGLAATGMDEYSRTEGYLYALKGSKSIAYILQSIEAIRGKAIADAIGATFIAGLVSLILSNSDGDVKELGKFVAERLESLAEAPEDLPWSLHRIADEDEETEGALLKASILLYPS